MVPADKQLSGYCRPSGDFQTFESAAVPSIPPVQASVIPSAAPAPAPTASVDPPSSVDLLGDLNLSLPSMPMSLPIQPQSFASPTATAQSPTLLATGAVALPETATVFSPIQSNALTTGASVAGTLPTATLVESVRFIVHDHNI